MASACAVDPIQLPDFDVAARSTVEITDPAELPELCKIPFTSADCYQRMDVYDDIAFDNTELAQLNADIARDGEEAYDYILSAAKKQQEISQIREEMLQMERRDHFIDNLWHRGLILALAIGFSL